MLGRTDPMVKSRGEVPMVTHRDREPMIAQTPRFPAAPSACDDHRADRVRGLGASPPRPT